MSAGTKKKSTKPSSSKRNKYQEELADLLDDSYRPENEVFGDAEGTEHLAPLIRGYAEPGSSVILVHPCGVSGSGAKKQRKSMVGRQATLASLSTTKEALPRRGRSPSVKSLQKQAAETLCSMRRKKPHKSSRVPVVSAVLDAASGAPSRKRKTIEPLGKGRKMCACVHELVLGICRQHCIQRVRVCVMCAHVYCSILFDLHLIQTKMKMKSAKRDQEELQVSCPNVPLTQAQHRR